jgi:hypothetical protein
VGVTLRLYKCYQVVWAKDAYLSESCLHWHRQLSFRLHGSDHAPLRKAVTEQ